MKDACIVPVYVPIAILIAFLAVFVFLAFREEARNKGTIIYQGVRYRLTQVEGFPLCEKTFIMKQEPVK